MTCFPDEIPQCSLNWGKQERECHEEPSEFYQQSLVIPSTTIELGPDCVVFVGGDIPRNDNRQSDLLRLQVETWGRGQDLMWVKAEDHIPGALDTFGREGMSYLIVDLDELSVSEMKRYT